MWQGEQTGDAAAAVVGTSGGEPVVQVVDANPVTAGFGEFVKRVTSGDLGADTWVLLWDSVGQRVLLALVLIVAMFMAAGWLKKIVHKGCKRARIEETLSRFLANLARYAVIVAGGVAILGTLGVETASFAAALAAIGFAIGMGLSGTLSNVAAGIMLLFFRPFKVGDVVNAAGVTGTIYEINLFSTEFDTFDNRRIIVPNNAIFTGNIENVTYHKTRRVDVTVGTEYDADLDKTRSVLERVARSVQGGLADPAPAVVLSELGGSSINWAVRVWANTSDFWPVKDRLTRDIKVALDEAGITIPFPQMDIRMDGMLRRLPKDRDPRD
jgi:small conductance mechanosensitive channel